MYIYPKAQVFQENERITVQKNIGAKENPHTHEFIEIVYILSGTGKEWIDGKEYPVSDGSLMFINYGQTHAFCADREMVYYNILLEPEAVSEKIINADNAFAILSLTAFSDFSLADTSNPFVSFSCAEREKLEYVLCEMYREYQSSDSGRATVLKSYLSILLAYIFRKMLPGGDRADAAPSEMLRYIETHFNENLTLSALAKKCFYSPKYFSRVFKERYGITVSEYIQKKRMEKGRELLENTDRTVEEISSMVGYCDATHFYKYFKRFYGITPKEHRKNKAKI